MGVTKVDRLSANTATFNVYVSTLLSIHACLSPLVHNSVLCVASIPVLQIGSVKSRKEKNKCNISSIITHVHGSLVCFVPGPHTLILHWGPADYVACPGSKCVRAGGPQSSEPALNLLSIRRLSSRQPVNCGPSLSKGHPSGFTVWLTLSPWTCLRDTRPPSWGRDPGRSPVWVMSPRAGLHWGSGVTAPSLIRPSL